MKIIELGTGNVKIEPCFVAEDDRRQALLLEPVGESHPVGMLTGDPAGPHIPGTDSVLIILGSVASATVLLEQLRDCIGMMMEPETHAPAPSQSERLLGDLLAVMHRDGGQHTASVGLEQSVKDATAVYTRCVRYKRGSRNDSRRLGMSLEAWGDEGEGIDVFETLGKDGWEINPDATMARRDDDPWIPIELAILAWEDCQDVE